MDRRSFDAFTRRAALIGLGAAGLATLASPLAGDAGVTAGRRRQEDEPPEP